MNRSQRSLIAKLRLGVLPLKLETGRWKDVPLEKRLCPVCEDNCLEDEIHFVVYCEQYKATRTAFLQDITDKTDIVVKGSEVDIIRAILSKEALGISGRYLE